MALSVALQLLMRIAVSKCALSKRLNVVCQVNVVS